MNEAPDTRTALLDAARPLFARHGFEAASIRAITAAAGANLGAITYHFGSKDTLYDAVLETVTTPLVETVRGADRAGVTPLESLDSIVRALVAFLLGDPDLPLLIAHELARDHAAPEPMRRAMQEVVRIVSQRIVAGQRDGSIVTGDPVLLTFSIVAQPIYLSLVRRRMRDALGIDTDAPAAQAHVVEHIACFVRRGLQAPGRST